MGDVERALQSEEQRKFAVYMIDRGLMVDAQTEAPRRSLNYRKNWKVERSVSFEMPAIEGPVDDLSEDFTTNNMKIPTTHGCQIKEANGEKTLVAPNPIFPKKDMNLGQFAVVDVKSKERKTLHDTPWRFAVRSSNHQKYNAIQSIIG